MKRIYLISKTGAIWTDDEKAANAAESVGYQRCSKSSYHRKIREIRKKDNQIAADLSYPTGNVG